ncbi:MAG: HD domain-containing phosphohydrolase [Smithella sp.]
MTRYKVLFVDDERYFLDSVRRILKNQNKIWQIDCVESGVDALRETARIDYDVIVTDINMPYMNGFELLAELRKSDRTRDIPVIVLTGNGENDLKRRALELDATDLLTKPVHPEDIIARLRSALRTKDYQDQIKAYNRTLEAKVAKRTAAVESSRREIIWRLAKAGEFRDEETGNHVARVGCFCRTIAERLGMDNHFIESIFLASPLHDIGKIGIPDSILLKPGELTDEERRIMKRHCAIGAGILSEEPRGMRPYLEWRGINMEAFLCRDKNRIIEMAIKIALNHHEKWDGTGYPQQLANTNIPIEARIVALADVYDALCSKRPYKAALPEHRVLEAIREGAGNHFDPAICKTFLGSLNEIHIIKTKLSD